MMAEQRTGQQTGEQRFRPDDGCPLFSERLEEHLVAVSRGETPGRGRFCGHCYTPLGPETRTCPHCGEDTERGRAPVDRVPAAVVEILREQRKTEGSIVRLFAYTGLLIAVLGGLAVVLGIPAIRESLIVAFVVYSVILLIGGRVLAGVLGGYYGDRIAYERARAKTLASWQEWLAERDAPAAEREG